MNKSELLKRINNGIERGAKVKLAEILGVKPQSVTEWFNGRSRPSEYNVQKMSALFSIDEKELWDMFDGKYDTEPALPSEEFTPAVKAIPLTNSNTIQLPILADAPAGLPEFSDRDIEMFVDIPRWLFPKADFIVRCIGDSLEPKIHKNDFCVIRKMDEALDGKAMLVKTEDGITMKIVNKKNNSVKLSSTNPKYKPFTPSELSIIGLIIGHWSRDDKESWN